MLADPVFAVNASAIALRRVVEVYQWRESATQACANLKSALITPLNAPHRHH